MSNPLSCLRRIEPSAALIPHGGQRTLAYVPAEQSDIRNRIHEFNRGLAVHGGAQKLTEVVAPALHRPVEVVRPKIPPRRLLLQEDRAEIEALKLLIGPAFRAALKRAAASKDSKPYCGTG